MAAPTEGTRNALIHVVKYLKGHTRCVNRFYASFPSQDYKLVVHCDSDWANSVVGRKFCSGGVVFLSGVPITFWSNPNQTLLSPAAKLS